jgi:hypothetical protein
MSLDDYHYLSPVWLVVGILYHGDYEFARGLMSSLIRSDLFFAAVRILATSSMSFELAMNAMISSGVGIGLGVMMLSCV